MTFVTDAFDMEIGANEFSGNSKQSIVLLATFKCVKRKYQTLCIGKIVRDF